MKIKYLILLFFFIISIPVEAQLYKPFASFRVIKTDRFDIIFPSESESSARLLASYADRVYKELSALFGIEIPGRIQVTFTPYTDMFNGFYNPVPYPHIVLYDTPADLEWTNFSNSLESLFIHELTHAVSLNTRGPAYRGLRNIFGAWVTPSAINAPAFMIEGVTIAMESMTGFGRANDPLVKQRLRQAIHEGNFLKPFQASGMNDLPSQNGIYYIYGGLFSSWLIHSYGMEKYTELWRAMGDMFYISFIVYRSGFYRIFKDVYEINFIDAWNAFKESLALDNLEENSDELLRARYRFFAKSRNVISAVAAGIKDVYILDGTENKIRVYGAQAESFRSFNADSFYSYDIDVSADESAILISGYRLMGERYSAFVTEQKTDSGRKTGRSFRGLYKARYFREGVIGLRSNLHNNNIVYEDFNGRQEILFCGGEELVFSGPQALDGERIVFIAARSGERELLLYNCVTRKLFRIESAAGSGKSAADELWRYSRGLRVCEGKLLFSHNIDDRMYKFASIDLEAMQAVFSSRDFSGGVFYPVSVNNSVYYRGAFTDGDGFFRFPETADSISGTTISIKLVEQNPADYGFINANVETSMLDSEPGTADRERGSGSRHSVKESEVPAPGSQVSQSLASRYYFSPKYLNPFKLWLPLPLLRLNNSDYKYRLSFDGAGILSVMMDPTDRNLFILLAFADFTNRMAVIEHFSWRSTTPGFPLLLEFSDKIVSDLGKNPYRETRAALSGSFSHYPGRWGYGFSLGAGYFRAADDDGGDSAYKWKESASAVVLNTSLAFSNLHRSKNELFGSGFSLNLKGSGSAWASYDNNFYPRAEGIFRASFEMRFPLNIALYGAYDKIGMNLHGESRIYGKPIFENNASKEYQFPERLYLTWIGGGEISVGLFSVEIQNSLSHIYFNRFFGTLTLRNVVYDSLGMAGAEGIAVNNIRIAQSLVLNLKMVAAFLPIKALPFYLEPNIWGAWKFSNTITGHGNSHIGNQLSWGIGFNYRY